MLNTLINTGVCASDSDYIQHKIKLSNQLVLVLSCAVIFYGILFSLKIPEFLWITVVFAMIYGTVLLLNRFGWHIGGRLVLSLLPQLTISILHAILLPSDQSWLISLVSLQVALFILPWLLFDLFEYPYLMMANVLGVLSMSSIPLLNTWLGGRVETVFFQQMYFETLSLLISFSLMGAAFYFFKMQASRIETNLKQLLQDLHAKNQKFEHSEAETQKYLQQIENNQQEEERRNWASEGLAEFAAILRRTDHLEQTYDEVISELVKYMGANQGGLYMVENTGENETPTIRLVSCYAYERKKYLEQHINIGQGLIGQAYLERAPIFITRVPENYVRITSGLGQAAPRSVLVIPLMINDQVEALIELASFTVFEPYQVAFLQSLGESMASAVASNRINIRTKQLLEESQQQTEEMRAQEEEMRQNMEEMQATQEEMRRKSSEIESRMKAINESGMASIEFDLEGNITMANANFLALMGYGWEEIRGQHHRIFVTDSYAQSEEYEQFWKRLGQGISQMGEYEHWGKDGKRVFIQGSYSVLHNPLGQAVGVVKLAADITQAKLAQEQLEQQANELQTQEEIMRQNLEEILQKSFDIESRMNAIDESGIASIEFDLEGNITMANANFLALMGYGWEEIRGQHHRIFVTDSYAQSEEYEQFWKRLGQGISQMGEYEHWGKDGKRVFIQGSYSVLRNSQGKATGVLKLAADITEAMLAQEKFKQQARVH